MCKNLCTLKYKNKINKKETEKGRKHCAYTKCINSSLQSGAEKLNPAGIAQIVTSDIADIKRMRRLSGSEIQNQPHGSSTCSFVSRLRSRRLKMRR